MESNLTANELIDVTQDGPLRSRYTVLSLEGIERAWSNLKAYLPHQSLDDFTRDVGMAFLAHRHGFVVTQAFLVLSPANQDPLRAIDILADFLIC